MIDLHCHLLPGVDDGAQTLQDGLDLACLAVADGIKVAALTPHVHPGRYGNVKSNIVQRVGQFQEALDTAGIDLQVRPGGEVRLTSEVLELLLDQEIPYLGEVDGYKIMLLEFPHQLIPLGSDRFIDKLLSLKIRPLIAHPERNKAIVAQPEKLGGFIEMGCWSQLTAASVTGKFGQASLAAAKYILKAGWAHVLATDAHNTLHRPPHLKEGRQAIAALCGETKARQMVSELPAQILGLPA